MTGEELRQAIQALLTTHPEISPSATGSTSHIERYLTKHGLPIGFEPDRTDFQNLWVRADNVRRHELKDLEDAFFHHAKFADGKPNHHLFTEKAFKDCDLIRYRVTDLWQAVRVIQEVAGEAGVP